MRRFRYLLLFAMLLATTPALAQGFSWQSVLALLQKMFNEASAWAVSVKQTALSANVVARNRVNSQVTLANAMSTIDLDGRVLDALRDFHSDLGGQPMTIKCLAQEDGKLFVEAE